MQAYACDAWVEYRSTRFFSLLEFSVIYFETNRLSNLLNILFTSKPSDQLSKNAIISYDLWSYARW